MNLEKARDQYVLGFNSYELYGTQGDPIPVIKTVLRDIPWRPDHAELHFGGRRSARVHMGGSYFPSNIIDVIYKDGEFEIPKDTHLYYERRIATCLDEVLKSQMLLKVQVSAQHEFDYFRSDLLPRVFSHGYEELHGTLGFQSMPEASLSCSPWGGSISWPGNEEGAETMLSLLEGFFSRYGASVERTRNDTWRIGGEMNGTEIREQ